jgi:four helix bundle protein
MVAAMASLMASPATQLRQRTNDFAVRVVKFCERLPNSIAGRRIGQQLIDAATSVAANYRAACRAHTRPLFVSKLAIVAEEADESQFWLGLIIETRLSASDELKVLHSEAGELTAIFTASLRTAKQNYTARKIEK